MILLLERAKNDKENAKRALKKDREMVLAKKKNAKPI